MTSSKRQTKFGKKLFKGFDLSDDQYNSPKNETGSIINSGLTTTKRATKAHEEFSQGIFHNFNNLAVEFHSKFNKPERKNRARSVHRISKTKITYKNRVEI